MRRLLPCLLAVTLAACAGSQPAAQAPADLMARARALAQRAIIVDGHIDAPYRLTEEPWANLTGTDSTGDFDYGRARAGGLDAPFMSIYIPAEKQAVPGVAAAYADSLITNVERWVAAAPDKFEIARSPADVVRIAAAGKVALPLGLENGAPLTTLADVQHFYSRGIRYVTLTHGKVNQLGDSSYDSTQTWHGLSPYGRAVVGELNRLGVLVDISHVSDATAFDVLRLTRAPVVATHSGMRHFTPGWKRNMSDSLLAALGRNGGVVMIPFGATFLRSAYQSDEGGFDALFEAALRTRGLTKGTPEAYRVFHALRRARPVGTVGDVADHIDHAVQVAGIDHVGLGSDFDGVTRLPAGLTDVSMYPNLVAELLRRGYTEADVTKVLGGNLLRVWREAERVAGR